MQIKLAPDRQRRSASVKEGCADKCFDLRRRSTKNIDASAVVGAHGANGYNAAGTIAYDLGIEPWWAGTEYQVLKPQ